MRTRFWLVVLEVAVLSVVLILACGTIYGLFLLNGISAGREVVAAGALCLVPGVLTALLNALFVARGGSTSTGANPMAALGGMGLRVGIVAAGILILPRVVPDWQTRPFFYSVLVVYFLSLVIETGFLLATLRQKPAT